MPLRAGRLNAELPEPVLTTALGRLYNADCEQVLESLQPDSVDLFFADPPFNLNKDYGSAQVRDARAPGDYLDWSRRWLGQAVRILKPGGALYVFNLPAWNVDLAHYLKQCGMTFRHWIAVDIKCAYRSLGDFILPITA